jgi:hypothetical protein
VISSPGTIERSAGAASSGADGTPFVKLRAFAVASAFEDQPASLPAKTRQEYMIPLLGSFGKPETFWLLPLISL